VGSKEVHLHSNNNPVDPLNDLNACHEMEKVLTDGQWLEYERQICRLNYNKTKYSWAKSCIYATASQRCEAFLKTIGKWQESSPQKPSEKETNE
jgi:hypothetical protein